MRIAGFENFAWDKFSGTKNMVCAGLGRTLQTHVNFPPFSSLMVQLYNASITISRIRRRLPFS